ncbi:MAG TPA: glycosyl hydrolase [Conexibacter sp.]|jgi:hypothetical protein
MERRHDGAGSKPGKRHDGADGAADGEPAAEPRGAISRRRALQLGAIAGAGALGASGASAEAKGVDGIFGGIFDPLHVDAGHLPGTKGFGDPDRAVQPKFRWWWPNAEVDDDEIAREIDEIADAGFGGVEIADVHRSVKTPMDVASSGWGSPRWTSAVATALAQAQKRGMTVDVTAGPSWPAAATTITPDSDGAIKELAHGLVVLTPGQAYSGPVPDPVIAPVAAATRRKLIRVEAACVVAGRDVTRRPVAIQRATLTDLTDTVRADGTIAFTAPTTGAQWVLVSYWERGSGQQPEAGPFATPTAYVIDHFSNAGSQALIDTWEQRILTPTVRKLLQRVGGTLFEDSLEIETDATLWTPKMAQAFSDHLGYDVMPVIASCIEQDEKYVFDFDDGTHVRFRNDYNDTLSQLYIDHHIGVLQPWAHSLGLKMRVQPYGLQTDAMMVAALLDIPEGESLGFKNLDDYKSLAGPRDVGGRRIVSNEAAGLAGAAYSVAWDVTLKRLMPQYSAGVNQAVFHGFAYRDYPGAAWPGYAAFSPYDGAPGYGEAWGPRQPTWGHVPDIAGYLTRTQHVLQLGVNQVDAAFFRQKGYVGSGFGAAWFTTDGVQVGWTHNFLAPRLLHLPSMQVRSGRLAPDTPSYKVLVFEGDAFVGKEPALQLDSAQLLLSFAKAGLPMIVIGNWSAPVTPGYSTPAELAQLKTLVDQLLALPNVKNVVDRPNVIDGLTALGIPRDVEYATRSLLLNAHRVNDDVDYFYFVNSDPARVVDDEITLTPTARGQVAPFTLDAWSGEVTPIPQYSEADGKITVRVTLKPGQTTIVALAGQTWWNRLLEGQEAHVTSTEASSVRADRKRLVIRSSVGGSYKTTLSDGRTVKATIPDVPAAMPLASWSLEIEDWQPGTQPWETIRPRRTIALSALAPWVAIPGLENASGIGRYTTTVTLGKDWNDGLGALLDLGEVYDTFRVFVNGKSLGPLDQLNTTVDVGDALKQGKNTLLVEVASTLNNRLRVSNPAVFGKNKPVNYGLIGPVSLLPYGEAVLPKK